METKERDSIRDDERRFPLEGNEGFLSEIDGFVPDFKTLDMVKGLFSLFLGKYGITRTT